MPRPTLGVFSTIFLAMLALLGQFAAAQPEQQLVETGKVLIAGHEMLYRIRNLPVSSFPDLPEPVANVLNARNCLIPQTYEAHRPENVIHASLERPGSNDWAVLCSVQGQVSLLVFLASAPVDKPVILATAATIDRLQPHGPIGELGFNWGIDPASPQRIHEAQVGMTRRPPPPDHDCLADSIVEGKIIYRLYRNGAWEKVEVE